MNVLKLGTGVRNGLVPKGAISDGSNGMAGEAGHLIVKDDDGSPAVAGARMLGAVCFSHSYDADGA